MSCTFGHKWGWPRRRGEADFQVCSICGFERRSPVQFARGGQPATAAQNPSGIIRNAIRSLRTRTAA